MESVQQVGIDVSKAWFDAHVSGRDSRFSNDQAGFALLQEWLGKGSFHVCLEPTGGYERHLRKALEEAGIRVSVAHPFKVRAYARALGKSHKTDVADARLLAEFLQVMPLPESKLDEQPRRELRRLVLTWKSLQAQELRLRNQLRSPEMPVSAKAGLDIAQAGLRQAMASLMAEVESLLAREPGLALKVSLLESIKGVGRPSALQILAHLPEGELRSARELASYAGCAPCQVESGSSVRGRSRISPRCKRELRRVLFMCALVSRQHCPHMKAFGNRLAERGKAKKQVLLAVARKLTHAIYAVLSLEIPYDGAKLCPAT